LTILIDDAGSGDILWGVVIGAYRLESDSFVYDLIDVSFFKNELFKERKYLSEAAKISIKLVERLNILENEKINICQGDILNEAAKALTEKYGEVRIGRVKIEGRAQELVESAYTDELRNLGYEVRPDRTDKWGKSFWHMYEWVKDDTSRIRWVKTGFPNLKRYKLFQNL
jgi:hypothetical protein